MILVAVLVLSLIAAMLVAAVMIHDQAFEAGALAYREAAETFLIELTSIRTADRVLELADASLRITVEHPELRRRLRAARKGVPRVITPTPTRSADPESELTPETRVFVPRLIS